MIAHEIMINRLNKKVEDLKAEIEYYESEKAKAQAKIDVLTEVIEEETAEMKFNTKAEDTAAETCADPCEVAELKAESTTTYTEGGFTDYGAL